MTLEPLIQASHAIQIHTVAALSAFALGLVQFTAPKGTPLHRTIGWAWVVLMITVCVTAVFIHELRTFGAWSRIHLLAIFTLMMLPLAVMHARRHRLASHKRAMTSLFLGALVIAGVFTFWPGRIMHKVVFGS
ncbi:DUF2306 domain-containing protein [Pseudorhodoplanes sp.]|uniref:DUF2306 domain-containing protein n=1 Tax=Pseudorhodoplanes sp. TaxID=1934341 RepID=UPI00391D4367